MRQVAMHGWQRVLPRALVVSLGLHLMAALLVEVPPLDGGGGFPQGLRVMLQRSDAADGSPSHVASTPPPEASAPAGSTGTPRPHRAGPDRYLTKAEVDVPALLVSRPALVIPEHAYHSRLSGTVRARIYIGADGGVEKALILRVAPVPGVFEDAALEALHAMRYQPARVAGRAVKSQKVVEVLFEPRAELPRAMH